MAIDNAQRYMQIAQIKTLLSEHIRISEKRITDLEEKVEYLEKLVLLDQGGRKLLSDIIRSPIIAWIITAAVSVFAFIEGFLNGGAKQ